MIPKHPSTEQVDSSTFFDHGKLKKGIWSEASPLLTHIAWYVARTSDRPKSRFYTLKKSPLFQLCWFGHG